MNKLDMPELRYRVGKIIWKNVLRFSNNDHGPDIVAHAVLTYLKRRGLLNIQNIKPLNDE